MIAPATIALCAALVVTAACPAHAATARDPRFQPNLEATVRYLQNAQRENGGFAEPGRKPEAEFSAWVTLALAAAGINPRDQTTARQHYQAGHSAYSYLAEHAHEASWTTDFDRELLVVDATGTSPHEFGGVDLVRTILARQIAAGAYAGAFAHEAGSDEPGINDTIFAILALSAIHEAQVQQAIGRAAAWLEREQYCDGSWPTASPSKPPQCATLVPPGANTGEVDMSGAALEALNAAERADSREQWGFKYLQAAQNPNGGLVEFLGENEPNVASTAWVVQAMWSAAINPENWRTGSGLTSEEPLGYLVSMQQQDGHIRWKQGADLNGMWMTAFVAPALSGDSLPIPHPPYEPLPVLPPEGPSGATGPAGAGPGAGDGGVARTGGLGVIASARSGEGAPPFSRPQAGSRGHAPGGARQLRQRRRERGPTQRHNPGPARKRAVPTTGVDASQILAPRGASSERAGVGTGAAGPTRAGAGAERGRGQAAGPPLGGATGARAGRGGTSLPLAAAVPASDATTGTEVRGVLIGAPRTGDRASALEAGAPGLRSASAGGDQEQWLTLATCAGIALLVIAGALIEFRRPRVTL